MIWAVVSAIGIGLTLGLLGSGGSILTVPALVYLVGQPEKVAIASSLAIVAAISAVAAIPYARSRLVHLPSVVRFGIPAVVGTYLGAWVARWVPGTVQMLLFAGVMVGAAIFMLGRRNQPEAAPGSKRGGLPLVIAEGLTVGVITGLVGVGGGFLLVPALTLLAGLTMHQAIGTSLVIIAFKSSVGFAKYVEVLGDLGLALDWSIIGLFAAVGIVGSLVGRQLCTLLNHNVLQRTFAALLIVMSTVILVTAM